MNLMVMPGDDIGPDIAGRGIANPCGMILSAAMLIERLGMRGGTKSFTDAAVRNVRGDKLQAVAAG